MQGKASGNVTDDLGNERRANAEALSYTRRLQRFLISSSQRRRQRRRRLPSRLAAPSTASRHQTDSQWDTLASWLHRPGLLGTVPAVSGNFWGGECERVGQFCYATSSVLSLNCPRKW